MTDRPSILSRMFLIFGFFLLIPCVLAFQLVRVNYFNGPELRKLWSMQALEAIPIHAQRGNIYDSNGTLLATNTANYQIALDPKIDGLTRNQIEQLLNRLTVITGKPQSFYQNKLRSAPSRSRYVVLEKNLNPIDRDEIKNLNIRGVIIEESFRRVYTFGSLAAHVLGYVDYSAMGKTGLESYYNDVLSGEDGIQMVRRDPRNRISAFVGAPRKQPLNGKSLHTTIDTYIQAILEDELKQGVDKSSAKRGTGIIIDPKTGAVKAMANYPAFDPNNPGESEGFARRNMAIADMIEPGSTYKLVTAIAAVEQNVVDFDEIFETPANGAVQIHGLTLRDHTPLGDLNFQQVIQKSSNVAIAEIAMRLEPDVFYQYGRNLGFGSPTHIDLTGEADGRLHKPYNWSKVSIPWMAHGYEVLATPLQIAQAYAAFANHGRLMKPYVLDYVEDESGKITYLNKPTVIRQIAKDKTIDKLLPIFESVVTDPGTGDAAQVDGLRIAGKTGTAKKASQGGYSDKYVASFIGFFPVDDPKYVCLVILDEPKTSIYGGVVSAPIFRETAKRIAGLDNEIQRNLANNDTDTPQLALVPNLMGLEKNQALKILRELNVPFKIHGKVGVVNNQSLEAGIELDSKDKLEVFLAAYSAGSNEDADITHIEVPELRGMNMRAANNVLLGLGLKSEIIGSGTIFAQFPQAGSNLRTGSTVTVRGKAKTMELISKAGAR